MNNPDQDKRASLTLRGAVVAVLGSLRRILGSVYQVVFRDQLSSISRQTERLGSASVESVTYLGAEVRALDQRLAAIEREPAALRALLERREAEPEGAEEVPAQPPAA